MATMAFRDVSKVFGTGARARVVLEECSFEVTRGKLNVLIGPSGCGKTTTVNLLAGYERATRGDVTLDGQPVHGPSWTRLVVFQETALFPWMTVLDNVTFGPTVRGMMARRAARDQALSLLEKVGLKDFAGRYPAHLSGGMQRRAELARAMINNPKVMILDEPFRGLDAMTKELMWEYYSRLYEENRRTNFFVTTDIDEAVFLADRVLVMSNIPTQVRAVIDVDLPRPRKLSDLVESDRANDIKKQALSILHAEAMRSFSRGSKAAADFVEAYLKRASRA